MDNLERNTWQLVGLKVEESIGLLAPMQQIRPAPAGTQEALDHLNHVKALVRLVLGGRYPT